MRRLFLPFPVRSTLEVAPNDFLWSTCEFLYPVAEILAMLLPSWLMRRSCLIRTWCRRLLELNNRHLRQANCLPVERIISSYLVQRQSAAKNSHQCRFIAQQIGLGYHG